MGNGETAQPAEGKKQKAEGQQEKAGERKSKAEGKVAKYRREMPKVPEGVSRAEKSRVEAGRKATGEALRQQQSARDTVASLEPQTVTRALLFPAGENPEAGDAAEDTGKTEDDSAVEAGADASKGPLKVEGSTSAGPVAISGSAELVRAPGGAGGPFVGQASAFSAEAGVGEAAAGVQRLEGADYAYAGYGSTGLYVDTTGQWVGAYGEGEVGGVPVKLDVSGTSTGEGSIILGLTIPGAGTVEASVEGDTSGKVEGRKVKYSGKIPGHPNVTVGVTAKADGGFNLTLGGTF
jgi:hypothetical protein